MQDEIKISAILPNYNMAELLPRSIQSLLDQTQPFSEIIIVDDGSTDGSIAVIEDYMRRHTNLRLIRHEKNQGVLSALNTGIKHAVGDYVMLCAADDTYGAKIVEASLPVIQQFPDVGVICGDAVVERFDLAEPFYRTLPFPSGELITAPVFKTLSRKNYVGFNGGGGMLINRQAVINAEMLQLDSRWHGDWILYFVVAFRHGIYYCKQVFTHINMRKQGYSEGKNENRVQDKVMLDTVNIIARCYPDLWDDFRDSALLPHYALRYRKLFLSDPVSHQFITTRLLWKLIINNAM